MKLIIKERQTGKTTELIQMSADTGAYIVCINRLEAHRVFRVAHDQGLHIPNPITFDDFFRRKWGRFIPGFLFDNFDVFLAGFTNKPILALTMTLEPGAEVVMEEPHDV